MLSQIVLENTLKKKSIAYIVKNIIFQILGKLGNNLWSSCSPYAEKGILIMGLYNSLIHGKKSGNSISICATYDGKLSQFFSKSI